MVIRPDDYPYKLAKHIERNLSKGYTIESVRWSLLNQGHTRTAVDKAILLAQKDMASRVPKMDVPVKEEKVVIVDKKEQKKKGFFAKLFGLK